jgi:endoglycosylceramidase
MSMMLLFILWVRATVVVSSVAGGGGGSAAAVTTTRYLGPLVCAHPSCPTSADGGRAVNNSNFHLRDVAITAGPGGWYYLTGTSNSAGDSFWSDVWGVVRVWRSQTPLVAGSFVGGGVVFNLTRDCKFCGPATVAGGCRAPNSCAQCGMYHNDSADGGCTPKKDCGGRVWAPELHYLPGKAADVPGSGGWFISFHFHCAGGGSGVLQSTSGTPFGPFTDLVNGVPGGDVTLFQDPKDGEIYTVSSGGALVASRLSRNMSAIVKQAKLSPECGAQHCEDSAIGFEGPYVLVVNGTYFLSSSAFGNASQHGGPASAFNKKGAPTDSHYSSYMGSARTFQGPYSNGEQGKPGSWLALDSGGHNNYFEYDGEIYGTVWYGSEPNGDVPPEYKGLINLPSVAKMCLANGRLVQAASLKSDDRSIASVGLLPITLRLQTTGERVMVDSFGRERAFHGTNAVVKGPPWIPSRGAFDQFTSLTAKDFELMQSAGVNAIRLGVMWPGVEPVRGQYNHTYLDIVADIIDEAATYGIYILADMHEDVLSERFCGEGIPAWASQPNDTASFPMPLGPPYNETDPATGFPTRQDCAQHGWGDYGGTEALASAYTRLYQNYDQLTDAWGFMFAEVAKRVAAKPGLLGLELLNEPWGPPGHANAANRDLLQPSYDIVAKHIRGSAPEALIFFSGAIGDRTGDPKVDLLPLGFDHAPGGAAHSGIAFHSYLGQNDGTWPVPGLKAYYQTRIRDARNLSTALLMTESGSFFLQQRVRPELEKLGWSWFQWEWKDFCKDTNATLASPSQYGSFGACKTGYGEGPCSHGP